MSHVYQPLVIRYLVEAGGTATVRQLARHMAANDATQISFYERKVKEMPLRVLKNRGVIEMNGDLVSLTVSKFSFKEAQEIESACVNRITSFLSNRGEGTWSGLIDFSSVPAGIRYQVLKRDRQCLLCGAGPKDSPLQVDHIVPRSKGGSSDLTNLQTLCRACNIGKSNTDDTKF